MGFSELIWQCHPRAEKYHIYIMHGRGDTDGDLRALSPSVSLDRSRGQTAGKNALVYLCFVFSPKSCFQQLGRVKAPTHGGKCSLPTRMQGRGVTGDSWSPGSSSLLQAPCPPGSPRKPQGFGDKTPGDDLSPWLQPHEGSSASQPNVPRAHLSG